MSHTQQVGNKAFFWACLLLQTGIRHLALCPHPKLLQVSLPACASHEVTDVS